MLTLYSTEIQSFKANVTEAENKLQRLREKHDEVEAQKREINDAIAQAQRIIHIQTESTSSEVFRLKSMSFSHVVPLLLLTCC